MRILDNLQKAIFEVRSLLLTSTEVKKMVYFDQPDALAQDTPSLEQVKEYFTISPVFDITKAPFNKNTLISIGMTRVTPDSESLITRGVLKINVLTRSELWELSNSKIRPFEIANYIIEKLNNKKLSSSHKVVFSSLELAILSEDVNGYTLSFSLEEGSGLDEQF